LKNGESRQFCVQGHDTLATGRDASGDCCVCSKERRKQYRETFLKRAAAGEIKSRPFCKRGHEIAVVGRDKTGVCRACKSDKERADRPRQRVQEQAWRDANRELDRERRRAYNKANPDKVKQWAKTTHARHRTRLNAKQRERNTGWTPELYDRAVEVQQGRCAICGKVPKGKGISGILHADHKHGTEPKQPRELLCTNCNRALGLAQESVAILNSMISYLIRHDEAPVL